MIFTVLIGLINPFEGACQIAAKKSIGITRTNTPPEINGNLDDAAWAGASTATDFIKLKPYNGDTASFPSEVKLLYDDEALYVGAMLYDPYPDSIHLELSERDRIGMVDWFGIYIDCFNDYLTAYGFIVTASGVQIDLKSSIGNDEDENWDAVWVSQVKINPEGWVAELKIPFSALRFPKESSQLWGLQLTRNINRYREESTWNFINLEEEGRNNQSGELHGIENVNPPLRLSLVPYLSGYLVKKPETRKWGYSYNYGLDLKFGINESYTLDMTLVPDFGQVQSDDEIYNLSPFEVYYSEKRPFFMEGTELFDKGNVFYSRRVGTTPSGYLNVNDSLHEHEKLNSNPQNAQLINATKLSGKSTGNLAVGFFNAMTANTWADIEDTLTGVTRTIKTEPFTNYNMLVFDQALKNNSFVSLFNTNTYSPHSKYSANVTGTELKLTTRNNLLAFWGQGIVSQKYNAGLPPEYGVLYKLVAGKISGNFTFELSHEIIDDRYDPNDMGFLVHNNVVSEQLKLSYNLYKPTWKILDSYNTVWFNYSRLYDPRKFTEFTTGFRNRTTFKNFLTIWMTGNFTPVDKHDYYEPRTDNRYYIAPASYHLTLGYSPDYRKRFLIDWNGGYKWIATQKTYSYNLSMKPRFRVSDKLMIIYKLSYNHDRNNIGYTTDSLDSGNQQVIIFGGRDIDTYENTLDLDYKFTNRSSLSFRLRHYWITLKHKEYFDLNVDGTLSSSDYSEPHDFSYNIFNIDTQYIWNFAPGSEIRLVWKNAISAYHECEVVNSIVQPMEDNFGSNFGQLIRTPATNSFSVKLLYYIDYQMIKKAISQK